MEKEKIQELAELNKLRSTEKVLKALEQLKRTKSSINIKSVSDKAKISRRTIYNRPDLKNMILEAQSIKKDMGSSKAKKPVQVERIERLREINKVLIEDKKKILEQNMLLTKEIIALKNTVSDLEDRLYSQTNLRVLNTKKEDAQQSNN